MRSIIRAAVMAVLLACVPASAFAACTPATTPNTSGVTANSQLELLQSICNNQPASGGGAIAPLGSADSVSNFVAKNPGPGSLVGFALKIAATSGYVLGFDATALPGNGAVTSCDASQNSGCVAFCYPVNSNGTNGGASFDWSVPLKFKNGITLGFSSTGCDTLTASTTAKFSSVQVQ